MTGQEYANKTAGTSNEDVFISRKTFREYLREAFQAGVKEGESRGKSN